MYEPGTLICSRPRLETKLQRVRLEAELIFGATAATGGHVNFFVSCVNFYENNAKCSINLPQNQATLHTLRKFITNFYATLHTLRKFMTNFYATLHTLRQFITNFYAILHTLQKFMTNLYATLHTLR